MKHRYEKPSMKIYDLRPQRLICTSDTDWYDQPGGPGQF
jgi:hypothetical protein